MRTPAYQQKQGITVFCSFNEALAESEIDKRVGERVAELRKRAKLNQKELGKKLGLCQQVISAVEIGNRGLYARELNSWAKALQCTINDFFD